MKIKIVSQILMPDYIETYLENGQIINLPYLIDEITGEECMEILINPEIDIDSGNVTGVSVNLFGHNTNHILQ